MKMMTYKHKRMTQSILSSRYTIFVIIGWCLIWWIVSGAIVRDRIPIGHPSDAMSYIPTTTSAGGVFRIDQIQDLTGSLVSSPKESFDRWKSVILSTKWHLDIWMYDITYNRAKLPLVQLAESKLPMRIILENKKYSSFGNSYIGTKALLEDAGAKIMSDSDLGLGTNFVHAKTFVTSQWAIIQTANLTEWGFNKSREYYTQITNSWVVANIQALFDADRKGKPLKPSQIHPNILVCPINCRTKIQALIKAASGSIWIQNQYLEDPALLKLVKSKQSASIDIQMVLADNDFAQKVVDTFGKKSISIVTNPYPHAKMMLIDDHYLLISSINYSTNSMDHNREIGVIITNRDAIEYFKTRFLQDRTKWWAIKTKPKINSIPWGWRD
jgi:cardiolipin synthase A/B